MKKKKIDEVYKNIKRPEEKETGNEKLKWNSKKSSELKFRNQSKKKKKKVVCLIIILQTYYFAKS